MTAPPTEAEITSEAARILSARSWIRPARDILATQPCADCGKPITITTRRSNRLYCTNTCRYHARYLRTKKGPQP